MCMPMISLCLPRIAEPIKLTVLRRMDEVGWVGRGSHGSTGGLQEQRKGRRGSRQREDSGEQTEASGHLALSKFCADSLKWKVGMGTV